MGKPADFFGKDKDHAVSGSLRPVSVLLCDDIRHEIDGSVSLMGVAMPTLQCREFPVARRAAFGLIVNLIKAGETTFTTTLKWKGEPRWSVEHTVSIDGPEDGAIIPLTGTISGFDGPGEMVFELQTEGETYVVQTWTVEQDEDHQ